VACGGACGGALGVALCGTYREQRTRPHTQRKKTDYLTHTQK